MIRKGIFYEMGITASEKNAEDLEKKIIKIVGKNGKECDEVWSEVRRWLDDQGLKETLRKELLEA